ncbi:MAG: competence/damage-inducible protein A [Burkholderiales bacterium]|nr:competence/damage-inducible protein A [Burkholderiales bacterium]
MNQSHPPVFGALIIGDEILSGRRADKHLPKLIELLSERGLALSWAQQVGDDPVRITRMLTDAFSSGDVVFSFGGIGATPDDHTRQCAAAALQQPLMLHPQARVLITERMVEMAAQQGAVLDMAHPDTLRRLQMGEFPVSASIIPNPYNRIPGFSCRGAGGGAVHFVPGFPVMAWPMVASVLDQHYAEWFSVGTWVEHSVIVYGAMEATLTPLMVQIESAHPGIKVFSLPCVDHPVHGKHIDLGVKGSPAPAHAAFLHLKQGLQALSMQLGPEMVRN